MQNERILDVFPASDDQHRLVLAIAENSNGDGRFVLRQETYSGDVGWFVQSRISIEPAQLAGIKAALTCGRALQREPHSRSQVPAVVPFRVAAAS